MPNVNKENENLENEDLNKSIDALLDDVFSEDMEKSSAIDIAGDAKTTADAAANQAPKAQKDEARGAGRPKQISDVPQVDMDGRRDSEYDASITENENKESEPDEAKKQAVSQDQTQDKNRIADKPAAPKVAPFKKSEDISDEDWEAFQAFKKSQAEAKEAEELKKAEDMKKAEEQKQQDLIKSAVDAATEDLRKSVTDLMKTNQEQAELLKAMASTPQRPKSVTGIEQLEKSQDPDFQEPETFSKSQMLDAAEALVKSKEIPMEAVIELEQTGTVNDAYIRKMIEKKLVG